MAKDVIETRGLFQVRITPTLKWPFKTMPIFYDSRHVFLNTKDAEAYKPSFVEAAIEAGLIIEPNDKQKKKGIETFTVTVIPLELVIREGSLKS